MEIVCGEVFERYLEIFYKWLYFDFLDDILEDDEGYGYEEDGEELYLVDRGQGFFLISRQLIRLKKSQLFFEKFLKFEIMSLLMLEFELIKLQEES